MNVEEVELGYFGNIWVKQHRALFAGAERPGHTHGFDHVTLLARGRVEVTVEGYPSKIFNAPTFIVIKKEYEHNFKALDADSLWYCVFALEKPEYDFEDMYAEKNNPIGGSSENYAEVAPKIDALTKESE
jgi:hypothetical protein